MKYYIIGKYCYDELIFSYIFNNNDNNQIGSS